MSNDIRLPRVQRFPVEEGHIQLFARAIGDSNLIYSDRQYAGESALGGIIAPPTFSEASNHFDEDWPYRPRWGQPWFGSAATPTGIAHPTDDGGTAMHAETHFVYHRLLRPGMVLSVRPRLGRTWTKHGPRSGELKFHEVVSQFIEADGTPVLECTTVVLRTERKVASAATTAGAPAPNAVPDSFDTAMQRAPQNSSLKAGDCCGDVLVRNLSRAQIIQYAGVSGDFSPQHVDEVYNTQVAGYPSTFAHGMLTMGMAGRVVTDFVGDGRLKKFGFQFRQQVWPGDSLFAVVVVAEVNDERATAKLELTVTNQHGQVVGKGYASALVGS